MMYKLITHGRIILIGLSAGLYLSGCGIFSIDPPEKIYQQNIENLSSQEIKLVFNSNSMSQTDTLIIPHNEIITKLEFVDNDGKPVEEAVNDLNREVIKILLNSSGEIKQEWTSPAGYFGDNINSPFNYDSWVFEALKPDARNVVGKITFTITDDDLN